MKRTLGVKAALALAIPLLTIAAPARAGANDDVWIRVEVNRPGSDRSHVKVNVPLSLVEVVVDSVDKRELIDEIESQHPSLDIAKMWKEVRRMDTDEFVTVESEKEHLRVWKDKDFFRISVREAESNEASVEVKLPLEAMDYLFDSKLREWSFQELVSSLRRHLPLTLVEINKGEDHVKVWIETQ